MGARNRAADVMVVHDQIVTAVRMRPSARQREEMGAAEEDVEPVVVEADAKTIADQA
jgi:hypothetical protein